MDLIKESIGESDERRKEGLNNKKKWGSQRGVFMFRRGVVGSRAIGRPGWLAGVLSRVSQLVLPSRR